MNNVNKTEEELLTQEVIREQSALSVLNNKEFQRAFIGYRADLFDSFSKTKADEHDKREDIYRQIKAVDTVEAKLIRVIKTGKMAREQLSILAKAAKSIINMVG